MFVEDCLPDTDEARNLATSLQSKTVVTLMLSNEKKPGIMTVDSLTLLQAISTSIFPDSTKFFPEGTAYDHSAVIPNSLSFILDKPTVALRSSIEFMQRWHATSVAGHPDCIALIDTGEITLKYGKKQTHLTGGPMEHTTAAHNRLLPGKLYITKDSADACDHTLAKFVDRGVIKNATKGAVTLCEVVFDDPRMIADSALGSL